jgi:uridine phosphorylase
LAIPPGQVIRLPLLSAPLAPEPEIRPNHLQPTAELAERVLLPGDPGRALAVAQALLEQPPRMFNHARGLWGYTGIAADGEPLTVQATGMGGPSAAIVCEELIALGATTLVRIGTCGALDPSLSLGTLLAAEAVIAADGTSAALGANGALAPDAELLGRLVAAGARPVTIASSDLFYDPRAEAAASWGERGAVAVEMEAATILQIAARRGVAAACVLGVSDAVSANGRRRMSREELTELGVRIGAAGYAAVERPPARSR